LAPFNRGKSYLVGYRRTVSAATLLEHLTAC
jgi:hypothetical protein